MCPKMKLFAMEFRHILEVLCLRVLQKKFWAQFHDLCVQKRKLFDCEIQMHFGRSLPARFTEKSSGRNVRIYVSKNEAVCCEVQTHF